MNYKLVADAQLAALAMEHGLVMVSADSDFRLFPGLRIENPTIVLEKEPMEHENRRADALKNPTFHPRPISLGF